MTQGRLAEQAGGAEQGRAKRKYVGPLAKRINNSGVERDEVT